MSYKPHEPLADLARPSASLIRLIAGCMVTIAGFVVIGWMIYEVQCALIPYENQAGWFRNLDRASTPLAVLVNLYYFAVLIVGLAVAMRLVHNRAWTEVIGPPTRAVAQFLAVAKLLAVLYAVSFLLPSPDGLEPSLNTALSVWLAYLPLTMLGLLIQTSTEELIFRGYLQSQLAARFASPKVWIIIPSVFFGLLHFDPNVDETAAWLVVSWAFFFGLAAADLTARSGTLGPAIALHLINNTVAIALFAPEGNFDGLALFSLPFDMSDTQLLLTWMPVEMLILLCSWLTARLALRV